MRDESGFAGQQQLSFSQSRVLLCTLSAIERAATQKILSHALARRESPNKNKRQIYFYSHIAPRVVLHLGENLIQRSATRRRKGRFLPPAPFFSRAHRARLS
jgi:hypothetical protein